MRPCSTPILKFETMEEKQSKRLRKSNLLETKNLVPGIQEKEIFQRRRNDMLFQMLLMGQKLRTDHWISKMGIFGEFTKTV